MRVMRLGQHEVMHLPRRVCCCKDAEAQRSAIAAATARQAAQASEMEVVRKMEPHVTPHMADVAPVRAEIRKGRFMSAW